MTSHKLGGRAAGLQGQAGSTNGGEKKVGGWENKCKELIRCNRTDESNKFLLTMEGMSTFTVSNNKSRNSYRSLLEISAIRHDYQVKYCGSRSVKRRYQITPFIDMVDYEIIRSLAR